jgi:hypothetical protein
MAVPYNKDSSLNLYSDIFVDGRFMVDIWDSYRVSTEFLDNDELYVEHIVKQYDRWDLLAEEYYGERAFWWVLAITNNVEDPFAIYFDYAVESSIKTLRIIRLDALRQFIQVVRDKRLEDDVKLKRKLKREGSK